MFEQFNKLFLIDFLLGMFRSNALIPRYTYKEERNGHKIGRWEPYLSNVSVNFQFWFQQQVLFSKQPILFLVCEITVVINFQPDGVSGRLQKQTFLNNGDWKIEIFNPIIMFVMITMSFRKAEQIHLFLVILTNLESHECIFYNIIVIRM